MKRSRKSRQLFPALAVMAILALLAPAAVHAAPVQGTAAATSVTAGAQQPVVPMLYRIRAAHHGSFDRVVFQFWGGLPTSRQVSYVRTLEEDPRGVSVPVAGRATLQVRFEPARAHTNAGRISAPVRTAYPLPNVLTVVRGGDFEGVVTYGIGLASKQPFRVFTLTRPFRVVVDIDADFPTVQRRVWFFDQARFLDNREPFFVPVTRPVLRTSPAHGLMDRLFAGPTPTERARGLRFLSSRATDYTALSISSGSVARIRLLGGCSSGGSTVSVAGEIMPTLRQFPSVRWVKIYDPSGRTARTYGQVDSVPECLEP